MISGRTSHALVAAFAATLGLVPLQAALPAPARPAAAAAAGSFMLASGQRANGQILPPTGFSPAALATFYDAAPLAKLGFDGKGEAIALIGCDTFQQADIAAYEKAWALPSNVPATVNVDGASKVLSETTTADLEIILAVAPGASVTVYDTPSVAPAPGDPAQCTLSELADQFAAIAAAMPAKHFVAVADTSGASEDWYASTKSAADLNATHKAIDAIEAAGGKVFAASGINGAGPPLDEFLSGGELTVEYPASDPLVVAVGGTAAVPVSTTNFARHRELGWAGSGGGVSEDFALPSFQANVPGLASTAWRNVPDVAFVASEESAIAVLFKGGPSEVYGTAVGADAWAAYLALFDQQRAAAKKKPLTTLATRLYEAAAAGGGAFSPIDRGCNSFYCASALRYNNVTGLGVPDVARLAAYLEALP